MRGVLAIAIAAMPWFAPAAAVAAAEDPQSHGLDAELARLREIGGQLVRQRALQQALQQRADGLAREIESLQTRRDQISSILTSERDEAAALERQLDRLVPRVLARSAAIRERRGQAARLLADLATTSRQVELDPTIRARMLAVSPLLLRQLRSAGAGLDPLERRPEPLIAREREIELRAPQLIAEAERLQREQELQQQQRSATAAGLAQLNTRIETLGSEQRRLAQAVVSHEVAQAVEAGPNPDQPALRADRQTRPAGETAPEATVAGSLPTTSQLALAMHAIQPSSPQLMAAAPPSAISALPAANAEVAAAALLRPPAKLAGAALRGELATAACGRAPAATPLDAVFLYTAPLAGVGSQVPVARLPPPAPPITPMLADFGSAFGDQDNGAGKSGLTIVAMPGQSVAAPDEGHVVFAAPFRSYGLLLIIQHQREYHTLLWGLAELDVAVGDQVRTGQIVGVMAADADHPPELHVELRRNGRPVNPLPWLAANSNKVRG
jgi:septal ring factor EnvC (AmiA/AmiB activator)